MEPTDTAENESLTDHTQLFMYLLTITNPFDGFSLFLSYVSIVMNTMIKKTGKEGVHFGFQIMRLHNGKKKKRSRQQTW